MKSRAQIRRTLDGPLSVDTKALRHLSKIDRRIIHMGSNAGIFDGSFPNFGDIDRMGLGVII